MEPNFPRRAIIILADGTWQDLPAPAIDWEETTWPLGMPEIKPGEPVPLITPDDLYRRHEVIEGTFYVFMKASNLGK